MEKVSQTQTKSFTISDVDSDVAVITGYRPPYSECARFAKRPLKIPVWINGWSDAETGSRVDKWDLELSHEHLSFDESNDNIGFGPDGLFSEDMNEYAYRYQEECLEGSRVRRILSKMHSPGIYNFFLNNCQDFMSKIKDQY